MTWIIWILPLIAAVIGWFTNFIAVKMLFHPRKPKQFLGMTWHGVLPKRQEQLAIKIGKLVSEELFSSNDLNQKINNPENVLRLVQQIDDKIEHYFEDVLPEKHPMTYKLLPRRIKTRIKDEMLLEVKALAPNLINKQVHYLEDNLDVEKIISDRVRNFSTEKLEEVMWNILSNEFRFIEAIGAVIGFIIGLIQVGITYASLNF